MHTKLRLTSTVVLLASLLSMGTGVAQESHIGKLVGRANRGKALYQRYCIFCHGPEGDGRGESAAYLDPKPRDFTKAVFKCRSTPSGSLPPDLVAYIKTFSPSFQEEKPGAPVVIPPEPPSSPESVKRGAELFQSLNCWACHGKDGRGHGPSAAALTDNKGYPITPFDFTGGTRFKCGETDGEMFRDLVTGLDGTPMPSFADAMNPDQRWDIVHYIRSLHTSKKHIDVANESKGQ